MKFEVIVQAEFFPESVFGWLKIIFTCTAFYVSVYIICRIVCENFSQEINRAA